MLSILRSSNVFLWEEHLHKCPLCQYRRRAQVTANDMCEYVSRFDAFVWDCFFSDSGFLACAESRFTSMDVGKDWFGILNSTAVSKFVVDWCIWHVDVLFGISTCTSMLVWEERLHKYPLCQYHRQAQATTSDVCLCLCHHAASVFLLCWFWNFFLKSLCKSMLYLYGSWSSDVYIIMELLFVRVHIMCFFERSASTSAHSVNTTDRHRPWQWRVFVCMCVFVIMLKVLFSFVDSGISVWKVYAE